jgi:hypothetical protein
MSKAGVPMNARQISVEVQLVWSSASFREYSVASS